MFEAPLDHEPTGNLVTRQIKNFGMVFRGLVFGSLPYEPKYFTANEAFRSRMSDADLADLDDYFASIAADSETPVKPHFESEYSPTEDPNYPLRTIVISNER